MSSSSSRSSTAPRVPQRLRRSMGRWGPQSHGWAGFLRHRASLGERGLLWGHAHHAGPRGCHRQGGGAEDNLRHLLQWPPAQRPASPLLTGVCGTGPTCPGTSSGPAGTCGGYVGPRDLPAVRPVWTHSAWRDMWTVLRTSTSSGPAQSCWTAWAQPGSPVGPPSLTCPGLSMAGRGVEMGIKTDKH